MRRITLCCLTIGLFAAAPLHAQPDTLWSRTYGGRADDICSSIIQCADGGYALAGETRSFGAGGYDFWLMRTDENGDSLWSRTYGGLYDDACVSLMQTTNGGFVLAGYTRSFGAGGYDFWLVRTDGSGHTLWSHSYGSDGDDYCLTLLATADGGFTLAGFTESFGAGREDFWMVRTNDTGDSLWSRSYGGGSTDICYSLSQTADGGYALAGGTTSFGAGDWDYWLVRVNEDGDSLWSRTYGLDDGDELMSSCRTADGGYALAGYSYSFSVPPEGPDFWLLRVDEDGDSLWSQWYGGHNYDICASVIQTDDGGYALAGWSDSFGAGEDDVWLVRADDIGDSLWSGHFGGQMDDWCLKVIQTSDGGFALAGYTESFGAGFADFWLVKLGPENNVPGDEATAPLHFGLDGIYPNPFNATSAVSYQLSAISNVSLKLYDINGRLVQTLTEGWQEAGEHQVVIDANRGTDRNVYPTVLPAGLYLLRLTDGRQTAQRKVCLVK